MAGRITQREMIYGGLALAAALGAIYLLAGGGRSVARAAGALPGEIFAGAVEGVGTSVGIPITDEERCSADLAAGRTWDASFSCPAGRFIREGIF